MKTKETTTQATSKEQQEARRFWVALQNDAFTSLYYLGNTFHLINKYGGLHDYNRSDAELEKIIQKDLNYKTTLKAINQEQEHTIKNEPLFWIGNYWLYDENGNSTILRIIRGENNTCEIFCGGNIEDFTFENGILIFEGENVSGELSFELPMADKILDVDIEEISNQTEKGISLLPTCSGNITVADNTAVEVLGKKNTYSREGALSKTMTDAIEFWNGSYHLVHINNGKREYHGKEFILNGRTSSEGKAEVFLQFDGVICEDVTFTNNAVSWKMGETEGIFALSCDYRGTKEARGEMKTGGETNYFVGNIRVALVQNTMQKSSARLKTNANDNFEITTTQADLDAEVAEERKNYSFQFEASSDHESLTWSNISGNLPTGLEFFHDGVIQGIVEAGVAAGDYRFELKVEDSSEPPLVITEFFTLKVKEGQDELTIVPENLASITVGEQYSHTFQAHGGDVSNYEWSIDNTPLGLTFSGSKGNLSGDPEDDLGIHEFKITLTDGVSTVSQVFSIQIKPDPFSADTFSWGNFTAILFGGLGFLTSFAAIILNVVARRQTYALDNNTKEWNDMKEYIKQTKTNLRDKLIGANMREVQELSSALKAVKQLKELYKTKQKRFDTVENMIVDFEAKMTEFKAAIIDKYDSLIAKELSKTRRDEMRRDKQEFIDEWAEFEIDQEKVEFEIELI